MTNGLYLKPYVLRQMECRSDVAHKEYSLRVT